MTNSPSGLDALLAALEDQSRSCRTLGSPFTAQMCEALAAGIARRSSLSLEKGSAAQKLIRRLETWPGDPTSAHDSVPLRLAGGLHALVRRGAVPALARLYPPADTPKLDELVEATLATLLDHASFIDTWLNSPPQTNEVGRSAVLGAGMAALESSMPGLSWRLLELGASGGLNLIADRYALHLSGQTLGDESLSSAGVALKPEWRGKPLPVTARLPKVVKRTGCDLNPLDVSQPHVQERLLAYIWADQVDRLERAQSAITMVADADVELHAMGADDYLHQQLAEPNGPTLVMHSVAWQYFPADVKTTCRTAITAAAQRATSAAPLAWLGMEADGFTGSAGLRLKVWPEPSGEGNSRLLARVDYHGRWIEWHDSQKHQRQDPGGGRA